MAFCRQGANFDFSIDCKVLPIAEWDRFSYSLTSRISRTNLRWDNSGFFLFINLFIKYQRLWTWSVLCSIHCLRLSGAAYKMHDKKPSEMTIEFNLIKLLQMMGWGRSTFRDEENAITLNVSINQEFCICAADPNVQSHSLRNLDEGEFWLNQMPMLSFYSGMRFPPRSEPHR